MDSQVLLFAIIAIVILTPICIFGLVYMYYGVRYMLPYVPSSKKSIDDMLAHIDDVQNSTLLDLGSGTGDILLEVARRGGRAIGIEVIPFLVWITRWRAAREGLSDKITVICADMFSTKLPNADIVTLYVLAKPTAQLAPKLAAELPNAKVISHGFPLPGWTPTFESTEVKVYTFKP